MHNITVTSNNRGRILKGKRSIGLARPLQDALPTERGAFASISPEDKSVMAWIIKQHVDDSLPLYNTSLTPYETATTMLQNAYALGNQTALSHTSSFLALSQESLPIVPNTYFGGTTLVGNGFRRCDLPPRNRLESTFRYAWESVTI